MTLSVGDLKAEAAKVIADLARELAPGGRVEGRNYVVRSPLRVEKTVGAFCIQLRGAGAGLWKDFGADDGGDIVDLVAEIKFAGRSRDARGKAIGWLRHRLGFASASPQEYRRVKAEASRAQREREAAEAELKARKARRGFELWLAGKPLGGTLGEVYLRARGLEPREIPNLSSTFRFSPRVDYWKGDVSFCGPAILGRYRRGNGDYAAIHATWLRADGMDKADLSPAKLSLGEYRGCFLPVSKGKTGLEVWDGAPPGPVIVTEGPEDAWTEAYAAPDMRVWAAGSLSNIGNLPDFANVSAWLVVQQNDWQSPAAVRAFARAIETLRATRETPVEAIGVGRGKDPNDQLRRL